MEDCIKQALKNNLSVAQREYNKRSVKADLFQSKMNSLPNINGNISNNWNIGFAINPITNQVLENATFRNNNFSLSANMVLFNGFQNTNNIRLQKANYESSSSDLTATQNAVAMSVANAFVQVLMNTELVESRTLQIETTKEQLRRQEKLYELGGVNKVRLLQLKAQLASEEALLTQSQTQLDQSYLNLWQLMNIVPDTSNKIKKPEISSVPLDKESESAEQIYATFIQQSPEVKAAKWRNESARINKFIAHGSRSPRITLSAGLNAFYSTQTQQGVGSPVLTPFVIGYDVNNNPVTTARFTYRETEPVPFSTQFNNSLGKTIGLNMSIPILNGWQSNTSIEKAKINELVAANNQKQTETDLMKNVNQAYLDFKSAQKNYESNLRSFEANKEAYTTAESQYNLGAISMYDYINSRNLFLQSQTNFLQSKYQLVLRRKILDFYLGKPLY